MEESNAEAQLQAKRVVRTVMKAFYEDIDYVVMEVLMKHHFLQDDDEKLSEHMRMHHKVVRKVLNKLDSHRLIMNTDVAEKKSNEDDEPRIDGKYVRPKEKKETLHYWYIDYRYFLDTVRYRLYLMGEELKREERLFRGGEQNMFHCVRCKDQYTLLSMQKYLDVRGRFVCPHCSLELKEIPNADKMAAGVQNISAKLKAQLEGVEGGRESLLQVLEKSSLWEFPTNNPLDMSEDQRRRLRDARDEATAIRAGEALSKKRKPEEPKKSHVEELKKSRIESFHKSSTVETFQPRETPDFLKQSAVVSDFDMSGLNAGSGSADMWKAAGAERVVEPTAMLMESWELDDGSWEVDHEKQRRVAGELRRALEFSLMNRVAHSFPALQAVDETLWDRLAEAAARNESEPWVDI